MCVGVCECVCGRGVHACVEGGGGVHALCVCVCVGGMCVCVWCARRVCVCVCVHAVCVLCV